MTTINKLHPSGMYELYSEIEKRFLKFDTLKTAKNHTRKEALMPSGIPRYIMIFDNGGKTFDRYTAVFTKKSIVSKEDRPHYGTRFMFIGMSEDPFSPLGFGQHGELEPQHIGKHLGKRIKFEDLPEDCQKLVIQDYCDLWDIK